jgi:hypothetical protein
MKEVEMPVLIACMVEMSYARRMFGEDVNIICKELEGECGLNLIGSE